MDLKNLTPEDLKNIDLTKMSREDKFELFDALEERQRKIDRGKIYTFYPETGPLRRELYVPHMSFFQAGGQYRERGFMAANRVGKTEGVGCYELVWHLTGDYPDWWREEDGYHKFKHPIRAWAAGDTNETVRDILQEKLLGPIENIGTGLIPGDMIIGEPKKKPGVKDAIASVQVKNAFGGTSTLRFKSYEQGRKSFQGTEQHVILLDEEPPAEIRGECLIRTMATGGFTGGKIMMTFTPLSGMSEVVLEFMPGGKVPTDFGETGRYLITATWADAPHLSEEEKAALFADLPIHERDARTKGIPQLGSGAVYPFAQEDIFIPDFPIPDYWPRVYGFDHGWNATAALWLAWDREIDIVYAYSEYKVGKERPPVHADAVKARGDWIPGVSDPAKGTNSADGEQLLKEYKKLIPGLSDADNAVEAGLFSIEKRFSAGTLKIFKSCTLTQAEFGLYRRDKNGKVVKEFDHLMDCLRYGVFSGLKKAGTMPVKLFAQRQELGQNNYKPLTFGLEDDYDPLTNGL